MKKQRWGNCALCGEYRLTTREHVIPRGLYPPSKSRSKFQRITIATCFDCNNGTSDDDVHFRNVISVAGEPNESVRELWDGPISRSFKQVDGRRRASDVFALMRPAAGLRDRFMIYPARDERIVRIVRKIVRGLIHHHRLDSIFEDRAVEIHAVDKPFPAKLLSVMSEFHAEPDILRYRYAKEIVDPQGHSAWLLCFYERTNFLAVVSR